MDAIKFSLSTTSGYRATESPADLRRASETLFHPMKMVGYWVGPSQDHLCPPGKLGLTCPHVLAPDDAKFVDYVAYVERELDGVLDVYFPHASVHIYLS